MSKNSRINIMSLYSSVGEMLRAGNQGLTWACGSWTGLTSRVHLLGMNLFLILIVSRVQSRTKIIF